MNFSLVWTFITALPDLIKLLQVLQDAINREEAERKVKSDVKALHEAFKSRDASRITALFSNAPGVPVNKTN